MRPLLPPLLLLLAAAAVLGRPPLERTLFKNIPRTDPAREVIRTVLGSRFYSMRDGFAASDWTGLGYGGAWERAKRYFPGNIYFVRPGTYFMTHGHDADGRLFMEVHESAYLTLCLENRRTFQPGSVVGEYGRMLGAANGREAAAFREKTGRLESYFRDEGANRRLRKALGDPLYLRLLEELREEDYHMLAGGLMHEGMHAGLDDAIVARVQAEFNAGRRAVQWDEMRAFMAEIGYHGSFCRWAADDIAGQWRQIEGLLSELEKLRKRPALRAEADEVRFEQARTRAWAFAALARLRMREVWQSARRMRDLSASFRKDYVRDTPPRRHRGAAIEARTRRGRLRRGVRRGPSRRPSSPSGPSKTFWICGAPGHRAAGPSLLRSRTPRRSSGRSRTSAGRIPPRPRPGRRRS